MSTFARLRCSVRAVLAAPSVTVVPGRALDQRRRLVRRLARQRLAVDGDDHVAGLQAALLGRRAVEDLLDAQALLDLAARSCRRPRTGPRCRAGRRVVLRREVVREVVVQRLDRGAQRRVEQLLAIDLAVVVALDRVDRLLVEAAVGVGDERVAREARAACSGWPPSQMPSTRASGIRTARTSDALRLRRRRIGGRLTVPRRMSAPD